MKLFSLSIWGVPPRFLLKVIREKLPFVYFALGFNQQTFTMGLQRTTIHKTPQQRIGQVRPLPLPYTTEISLGAVSLPTVSPGCLVI